MAFARYGYCIIELGPDELWSLWDYPLADTE